MINRVSIAFILMVALTAVMLQPGCSPNPLPGGIKSYSGVEKGQEEPVPSAPPPASPAPAQQDNTNERHIVVTQANSVFSIGVPAGYREERQVAAEKPVNFWFEYLTPDVTLEINGAAVEIPASSYRNPKLGYTAGVMSFSYVIKNPTTQPISYNLHMEPAVAGQSVPAVTREKWVAP